MPLSVILLSIVAATFDVSKFHSPFCQILVMCLNINELHKKAFLNFQFVFFWQFVLIPTL